MTGDAPTAEPKPKILSVDQATEVAGLGAALGMEMILIMRTGSPSTKMRELIESMKPYREIFMPVLEQYEKMDPRIREYNLQALLS